MLVIQTISLVWYKQDRGSAGAEARQRFPLAFPLDEEAPAGPIRLHRLRFSQRGETFLDELEETRELLNLSREKLGLSQKQLRREIEKREQWIRQYRTQAFQALSELNVTNLALRPWEDGCAVSFFYDEHRSGAPCRRGHNQDYHDPASPFCGKDCLNETAFRLRPGQYGRILWNERRSAIDTGGWYYLLHACNLFCYPGDAPERDLLTAASPDYVYRQLADLY